MHSEKTYILEKKAEPLFHKPELLLFLWETLIHTNALKKCIKFYEKTNFMRNYLNVSTLIWICKNKVGCIGGAEGT